MHAFHRMYAEVMNSCGGKRRSGRPAGAGSNSNQGGDRYEQFDACCNHCMKIFPAGHKSKACSESRSPRATKPSFRWREIAYGFGGGTGSGGLEIKTARGEGGGGGGGVGVLPVGVFEVSPKGRVLCRFRDEEAAGSVADGSCTGSSCARAAQVCR